MMILQRGVIVMDKANAMLSESREQYTCTCILKLLTVRI